jgi:anthranilate synthase/aminodeoxychorismate synthase-like glutamine amidotransferase
MISRVDKRWAATEPGGVLILDNRDSFVFNLAHRLFEVGAKSSVVRSDEVTLDAIRAWRPSRIVISPGPGYPSDAGISIDVVRAFADTTPILGICLGHQAIIEAFDGEVVEDGAPVHGRATDIEHDGRGIFAGIDSPLSVGRYHSLAAREPLPEELVETARGDGIVMGVRHRSLPVVGLQFHPESVLTPDGYRMLENFLKTEA